VITEGTGQHFRHSAFGAITSVLLPVVLYGCDTWSLNTHLRVFENGVLRGIFGPKKDEETGGWRELHDEDLNLYCSPIVIRGSVVG
jgi:hypothetical protein